MNLERSNTCYLEKEKMNNERPTKYLIGLQTIALILVLAGCSEDFEGMVVSPFNDAQISAISDTVHFEGNHLVIETRVNRDFMPICPPSGNPMTGYIRLRDLNEEPLGFSVSEATLFIISRNKMWVRDLVISGPYDTRLHQLEMYANKGPKWAPGMVVDVVVWFRDQVGEQHWIKEENVRISESS